MERETKLSLGVEHKHRGGRGGGRGESTVDVAIVRAGGAVARAVTSLSSIPPRAVLYYVAVLDLNIRTYIDGL